MPSFEFVLILKQLRDSSLREALKRNASYFFEVGATLRKMENLGLRNLPYKITSQGKSHKKGHFFVFTYDAGIAKPKILQEKFNLDLDVVRATTWARHADIFEMHLGKEKRECTMYEDLLPPPYRPNVIALQELAEKKKKKLPPYTNFDDTDFLIY